MVAFSERKEGHVTVLTVSGDMTVQFSSEILSAILRSSRSSDALELDLRKVTAIDLAGLQLICSVYRSSRQHSRKFGFYRKIPAVIETAIDRAGFGFCLKDLLTGKGGDDER